MVLVVEKLDSYVVDRRMSRVLRDFSNDIQELANEKVQKDSLQLLRNRATCTQIAAKIREISISSTDRPNNLLKVPPPPPPQLAQILAEYPEEDSPQRGVKKVDAWLQDRQPGTAREDSGPGNEFESTSSFREKHFPPPHDEQQKEQYSGSEDSADEDEAAEIPQSAIQAFYTAAQFYQSDRVQDLFLEAVRRKFIHSRKREESTPNDNALGELENPAQDDNILERCERTMPDGSAPGEREGNAPDDSALKDYGDTVSNDIALEEPQETKQDDNAIENCDETAPDEIVLGEREFEGIAHDNSLRVQEPKSADMVSSLPIKSGSNLWPERFADGKSDITFESIPCVWSFSNQVKSWIEDKTLTTIIWWPLAPRRRPLQPNCVQVTWTCVSSYVADLCQLDVR